MKSTPDTLRRLALQTACTALFVAGPGAFGQTTAPAPNASSPEEDDELIVLSPFTVESSEDADRYLAKSTLAGTRIRTDLSDVASSISVITSEFLRDTGATSNEDLLVYTTNTEVGGVYGNYAGVGSTFIDGASESNNFLRPNQNTRVRGLDSADNTRDFFLSDIPWDGYIVDRIDLQRGPNSILFGIGSPAGIINASINRANFNTAGKFENRIGSFGSLRWSFDYNAALLHDELGVRFAWLNDDNKFRQKPAYNHDKRLFGAIRWDPKFLRTESTHTSFRANFEHGRVNANRPRVLPPWDRITPFFMATSPGDSPDAPSPGINRQTYDPYYAWVSGIIGYPRDVLPGEQKNFWIVQYPGPGIQSTANPMFYYDGAGQSTPSLAIQASPTTYFGLGISGDTGEVYRDASIDGFPYGSNIGIASFNEYAYNHWRTYGDAVFPAADKGFYKQLSLTDTSIFNFYDNLIDGPNKSEFQEWDAFNVAGEQTFFNNRLGVELVYDHQEYNDRQTRNLDNAYLSVDIRENLMVYPWAYGGAVMKNPNAGRAFVGSSVRNAQSANLTERNSLRATAYGEIRADDFTDSKLLTGLLGFHRLTGLYSRDEYDAENRNWARFAVDPSWSDVVGTGGDGNPENGSHTGGLVQGDLVPDWVTYLSGDLRGRSSAADLNLPRITAVQAPHGDYTIPYFDSHWNATGVDPKAEWINPTTIAPDGNPVSTETENPFNYAGWTDGTFNIRNADAGDIDDLYTSISRVEKITTSKGLTWQGYLLDENVVATVGWRKDRQEQRSGSSAADPVPDGVAWPNPPLQPLDPETGISEGTSTSWGVVVHTPRALREKLPWGSNISLTYSDGRNTRVENRYGFDGAALPNAKGRTKDFGVVVSTLENRIQMKVTHFETTVTDANLSSVTTEASTLGNNTYYLYLLESWGTASALLDLAGRDGGADGWEWYWNWAMIQGDPADGSNAWNAPYWNPGPNGSEESRARFYAHPETVKQTAAIDSWLSQMQPQSWYDAYGFSVDVAKAKAGDWQNAIPGWTPTSGVGGVQASGRGRINGAWPTGTANNKSEGWEFELVGQLTANWNISINASKTFASQTALGENLVNFIEAQHEKFLSPAGDLRLWWGGDATVRQYYDNNIWAAYQFQLQTNGKMVPEMAPWRFNLVTNYSFNEGRLKGANIGLAYRWQDGRILGYGLNADQTNLDVDKPYWSDAETWIDAWAGYERKLTDKVNWRIQVNLRSIGRSPGLVPLSVQPDGSPAAFKIDEGFTWQLTNTFSF